VTEPRTLLPTAPPREAHRFAWQLARDRRHIALGAAAALVTGTGIGLVAPRALGWIVDAVVAGRGTDAITWPVLVLVAVGLARAVLQTAGELLVIRFGEPTLAALRELAMLRALQLSNLTVEQAGSGDLVARVSGDVDVLSRAVRTVIPTFATAAVTLALTMAGLTALDWRFALAGMAAVPLQVHTLRWYLRRSGPAYAAERIAEGSRAQQLIETVGGANTVQALRLAPVRLRQVRHRSDEAVTLSMSAVHIQTRFFSRLNGAELVGLSAVLATGYLLVDAGAATVGEAAAAALYFSQLFNPINVVLGLFDEAQAAGAGLARLVGLARLEESVEPAEPRTPAGASVDLDDVCFSYPGGGRVVDGVTLRLAAGSRVALVGASGAGKTTLAKLLAGIHEPGAGRIAIGGVDLREMGPTLTRRWVVLVTQEVHVFSGTVAEDLRLAAPSASDDQLREALASVGALSWVTALPEGLATEVGEDGHRLSSTEAQHLALARVVLADPPIAVLDEATAEAGSAGARRLEAAARQALEGRTALVIAHRLSQAATADRIVVLDGGRVVEDGTHEALVGAGGRYAELWTAWADQRRTLPETRMPTEHDLFGSPNIR
jgi:ATP-binding cassette subfamily C protein